jgi:3-oxoadipate enol-lactonase
VPFAQALNQTHSTMSKPVLNWVKEGHGPTVVLSHGLGCTLAMWDEVVALLKSEFTLLRYDHRGHGKSDVPAAPYTIDMLADDAAALIATQATGPVHFVGLSMGGMTAQALAARHPQAVKSIVIANSASWYDETAKGLWATRMATVRAKGVAAIADGALPRWFTAAFLADAAGAARIARTRAELENTDSGGYVACCEAIAGMDLRAGNARISCPTLVIAGARDEATPPVLSEKMVASIAGAELRSIDAAHLSAVEQPEAFAGLVGDFLKAQGA